LSLGLSGIPLIFTVSIYLSLGLSGIPLIFTDTVKINGIPLSPKDKTSLHMKCIIVCSYRPEDGHTDDRNMKSVDKRHHVLRCNYKYSCVDGYNIKVHRANNRTHREDVLGLRSDKHFSICTPP
jgi:hypothetical protein